MHALVCTRCGKEAILDPFSPMAKVTAVIIVFPDTGLPQTAPRTACHQPPTIVQYSFCSLCLAHVLLEHEAESVPVDIRFCWRYAFPLKNSPALPGSRFQLLSQLSPPRSTAFHALDPKDPRPCDHDAAASTGGASDRWAAQGWQTRWGGVCSKGNMHIHARHKANECPVCTGKSVETRRQPPLCALGKEQTKSCRNR